MKTSLIKDVRLNRRCTSLMFFILIIFAFSCKKNGSETNTSFLKGYWSYLNGAEVYYDGVSNYAKGTKVPSDNTGFNFVVGEKYWQNLQQTSDTTWSLDHIVRTSNGLKTYNPTTFKKIDQHTILSTISGYGTETLTRKP
jgi:hypothetical protein